MLDTGCPFSRNFFQATAQKKTDSLVQNQDPTFSSLFDLLCTKSPTIILSQNCIPKSFILYSFPKDSKSDQNGKLGKLESFHSILASPHHVTPCQLIQDTNQLSDPEGC